MPAETAPPTRRRAAEAPGEIGQLRARAPTARRPAHAPLAVTTAALAKSRPIAATCAATTRAGPCAGSSGSGARRALTCRSAVIDAPPICPQTRPTPIASGTAPGESTAAAAATATTVAVEPSGKRAPPVGKETSR